MKNFKANCVIKPSDSIRASRHIEGILVYHQSTDAMHPNLLSIEDAKRLRKWLKKAIENNED